MKKTYFVIETAKGEYETQDNLGGTSVPALIGRFRLPFALRRLKRIRELRRQVGLPTCPYPCIVKVTTELSRISA